MPGARMVDRAGVVAVALALAGVVTLSGPARADTLQVNGETHLGRIVDLTPDGVEFDPNYGKGTLLVPFPEIEALESDGSVMVIHGDHEESEGRLLGVEDGMLLVGDDATTAERVAVATLFHAYLEREYDGSTLDQLHSRFRYWKASLDAGAAIVQSTTDTVAVSTEFRIERNKAPTHLRAEFGFRYATEDKEGEKRSTNDNILTEHRYFSLRSSSKSAYER